jgi:hypothetical protein
MEISVPLSGDEKRWFMNNKDHITHKLVFEINSKSNIKSFEEIIDFILATGGNEDSTKSSAKILPFIDITKVRIFL